MAMEATKSRFDEPGGPPADEVRDTKTDADEGTRFVGGGPFLERPMITDETGISRRTAIGRGLAGLAGLGGLLLFPGQALAKDAKHDSFVILLKGLYTPVVHGPNLGLHTVDLNDGTYSTTKIYPVIGRPGKVNINEAVGDFYVQLTTGGDLCAYDLPGGSIAMRFTSVNFTDFIPDGLGGQFLDGTADLTIPEATGKYRRYVGGHNLMLDRLHALAPGDGSGGYDEYCVCFVSRRHGHDD
jgi:hypothetical protein